MAEYIEREAAIDAIMKVYVRTAGYKARERVFEAKEAVHRLPVADVAPVVHCRHCRSYNKPRLGWCSVHLDREGPDDFCGYGARMDGGACNQVCKYNTPDRGCVTGEFRERCDLANVAGERGNGEAG